MAQGVLSDVGIKSVKLSSHDFNNLVANAGPSGFSDWQTYSDGEYEFKEMLTRLIVQNNSEVLAEIDFLKHRHSVDVVDVIDKGSVNVFDNIVQVNFNKTFHSVPVVVVASYDVADFAIAEVTETTKTYFKVRLKRADDSNATGSIHWTAQGY